MANKTSNQGGEPAQIDGGIVGTLNFQWQDDRYRHGWTFGADSQIGLDSVESPASTTWPLSPPLQQIHQQSFPDGREVLFGVGMAGRGHWSASYTLVPDLKCWIVELACRSSVTAESLQSSYRLAGAWEQGEGKTIACPLGDGQITCEALATAGLTIQDGVATISPTITNQANNSTLQWAFRLRANV